MANEHPDGSVKSLWQGQDDGAPAPAVGEIRRRAEANESRTRRRRLVVGVSIVNNVAICAALAWLMPPSRPFVKASPADKSTNRRAKSWNRKGLEKRSCTPPVTASDSRSMSRLAWAGATRPDLKPEW